MRSIVPRSVDELHRRVLDTFARLNLAPGSSLVTLLKTVANVSGLRIEIDPVGTREWRMVTGLVVVSAGEARVLVRKSDPRWYQFHVVLHELSHILLGHTGCASLPSGYRTGIEARPGQTVLARSATQADFERQVDFADREAVQEAEAEKLSQLIAGAMLRPRHLDDEAVLG